MPGSDPLEILLLGPKGSGKSALLKHMMEIYTSAEVYSSLGTYVPTIGVDVYSVTPPHSKRELRLREVGGAMSSRWKSYIPHCSVLVFTVDVSDLNMISETHVLLHEVLSVWTEIERPAIVEPTSKSQPRTNSIANWTAIPGIPVFNRKNFEVVPAPPSDAGSGDAAASSSNISGSGSMALPVHGKFFHHHRPKIAIAFTKNDRVISDDAQDPELIERLLGLPELISSLRQYCGNAIPIETFIGSSALVDSGCGGEGIVGTLGFQLCCWLTNHLRQ